MSKEKITLDSVCSGVEVYRDEMGKGEEYFCVPSSIGKTVEVTSIVSGGAVYGKNREIINSDWGYTRFRYKGVITDVFREGGNGAIRVEYLSEDGMYLGFYPQDIGKNLKVVIYD